MAQRSGEPQDLMLGSSAPADGRAVEKRLEAFRRLGWTPGGRLLDVGCGTGSYTLVMSLGFDETIGIDIQTDDLAEFRRRATAAGLDKIDIREQTVTDLPFPDDHFDTISTIECIEHIDDLTKGLSEMHRVLKPGGSIFITCPNRLFPLETHAIKFRGGRYSGNLAPFLPWVPPLHTHMSTARTFTGRTLEAALRQAGFTPGERTWIMPPFDRSKLGARLRPLTDRAESIPGLRAFGVSLVMVATK